MEVAACLVSPVVSLRGLQMAAFCVLARLPVSAHSPALSGPVWIFSSSLENTSEVALGPP